MHGALNFLKPAIEQGARNFLKPAVEEDTLSSQGSSDDGDWSGYSVKGDWSESSVEEDWRDWTPLSRDSPRVGFPLPKDEKESFSPPMPVFLFRQKPETLLPPNTLTKEDLLRHVVNLAADNSFCPECGEDVYEKKPGKLFLFPVFSFGDEG